jgi:hypothetical protein
MNRIRTSTTLSVLLFLNFSMISRAATNQVFATTGNGAVLTAPWICGQTSLRSLTVSAWVFPAGTTASTDRVIAERVVPIPSGNPIMLPTANRINFRLGIDHQGHPFTSYNGSGSQGLLFKAVAGSATVPGGQWTHLAAKYDLPYLTLYRNGHLIYSYMVNEITCNGWFAPLIAFPGTFTIGAGNDDPAGTTTNLNSYFQGKIDEVVVWNGALSDSDIGSWLNKKPTGTESNLIAYWAFDDGSASDASTNGITGNLLNSTSTLERLTFPATLGIHISTNVTVEFQTVQDALYSVEVSTNLMETNWISFSPYFSGAGENCFLSDTNSVTAKFYRVRSW